MHDAQVIWDLEDDRDGNYWHICVEGHGVSQTEVEEVLLNPNSRMDVSRSSGHPMAFGWTSGGQYITVVYEHILDDPLTLYPVTAYPVEPPRGG